MAPRLPLSKGSKILRGYRGGLILLAIIMLGLDCATIGLFESLMNPMYYRFYGLLIDNIDYALLLIADLFTIVFFALLIFRPQGFSFYKKLSSRILTGCRVFISLGLTALILCEPALELDTLMVLKFILNHEDFPDEPARAHKVYMDFVFCRLRRTPEPDMARMNQRYCQVARARWILGFVLGVLVLGELALSYWARDLEVQRERDGKRQVETGEYKTMIDSEAYSS
ncbi:hypothetical protein BGZ72_008613 [Mortierella alpina]|nr:hypothetical protein BGZ72_008613 [Mortierella alpina]